MQDYEMKDEHTDPYSAHHEIMLLLPWYVNKALHDPEMKAVEKHINVCLTCRRESAALQKLSLAVNQVDIMDSAAQASFARLKARIHRTGNVEMKITPERNDRSGQFKWHRKLRFNFPSLSKPLLGVLILLIMLIPGYFIAAKLLESNYRTLSSSENLSISKNEIRVVFEESTNKQQRDSVIQSVNGAIVGGPDARGVYLIRLKQASDATHILETISSLRKNSSVIFAEPAYALLSFSRTEASPK
ncbi:MAG: anti-sigma factor family protein [Methylococcales bacterium]